MTWNNRRDGAHNSQERIDQGLSSYHWLLAYLVAQIQRLNDLRSDHRPLLLSLDPTIPKAKKHFRFDRRWIANPQLEAVISSSWNSNVVGSGMYQIFGKLKNYRHALFNWSRDNYYNSNARITTLKSQLETAKQALGSWNASRIWDLEKELINEVHQEEIYWAQKARLSWLHLGDKNASYFHSKTIQRRRRNFIAGLKDKDGAWKTSSGS
ncbi:hypothetical protein P3X46_031430 [Hevea brasiliensis]|uniref:Reverse transcriptase zinc-binding domain-containing protein n=1 Tax=Hevea brasiliensis TaxID=3981 RepID=A0ABQ9KN78_HEVBR|nr:hypothetical protein P3X46_031430 [Hevea brasiliensis]